MGMTDEEKFRFDLTGYLLREAILSADEIAAIKEQVKRSRAIPNRCLHLSARCPVARRRS